MTNEAHTSTSPATDRDRTEAALLDGTPVDAVLIDAVLVDAVAERVYRRLLLDLRLDAVHEERSGLAASRSGR